MGGKSKIEWTEASWNPVRGCSIVSEGCRNCYAMRQAHRSNRPGGAYEGLTRVGAHGPTWTGDVRFVPELLEYPLQLKKPHRIFVNSMSDLFHEKVPDQQITDIFGIMALAHWHTFQILTKRPERMQSYLARGDHGIIRQFEAIQRGGGIGPRRMFRALDVKRRDRIGWKWPLPNVWLGVSVEDQKTADDRIRTLFSTQAAVRWISAEPLLGPVDLDEFVGGCKDPNCTIHDGSCRGLDWVVVGGESGPHARPMHPDWARSIRDQCKSAGVAFFFKQWGEWGETARLGFGDSPNAPTHTFQTGLVETYGGPVPAGIEMRRVGKKTAGRLLDGREWSQYPA
jgi:protein gp37